MNLTFLVVGVISLIVIMNFLVWKIYQLRILHSLTTLCIWSALSMWYTIPGVIGAIYQEETPFFPVYLDNSSATNDVWFEDFCIAFFWESLAVCFVLGGMILLHSQSKRRSKQTQVLGGEDLQTRYRITNPYKILALVIFGMALMYQVTQSSNDTYLAANSAELYGSSNGFILLAKQLSLSIAILISLYEPKGSYFLYAAFGLITLDAYFTSLGGNRIILLIPLILAVFRSLLQKDSASAISPGIIAGGQFYPNPMFVHKSPQSKKAGRFKIVVLLVTVIFFLWFVFIPVAQSIEQARLRGGNFNWGDVVSEAFSQENDNKLAISTIFWKLDSFTGGSILTREAGYGTAGFTPYIGSLLVMVPRALVPNRPVAGTSDGTIKTYPSRLVPKTIGVESDVLNVGVSPVHIALWQFGYAGFLVFIIGNILYFRFLDKLLDSKDFLIQTLGVYAVSFPTFVTVFLSPDAALKNFVFVLFLALMLKLGGKIRNTFRRRNPSPSYPRLYSNSRYKA
jgi:hypothetical protein